MIDTRTAPYGAFALRAALGIMFIAHGLLKVVVFTPAGTAAYFASLGLPEVFAYLTIVAEIVGGIAILAGVFGRWVSLSLVPLLLGTIVFAHGDKGWLFSNEGGGWEYPAFLAAAALAHGLIGDGAFALQDRIARTFKIKALATA